ncbi:hypothetical protein C7974DRAFT_219367 [Boeremia exigua]|uniref:uncharacterized protein n=1 Tax=Boeremia exigua TaxID=749465 RepID=UPI001E8E83BD|nr:uncharacterized protein C7974DRAFT_219367 [Boeremia exigua]KAH6622279.1 hypothetical protein C7974DRAFT_219367 [Boeremia exigua]
MDQPGSDSRKRRKITPTSLMTTNSTGPVEPESARPSHMLGTAVSVESGSWNYLAKWITTDESIIGDIEEEHYSDVSDESAEAAQDADLESEEGDDVSPEGPMIKPSKLGTDKVTEIINDCIDMYTKAWRPGKDETKYKDEKGQAEVPVVYDALALWEEAEAAGQREEFAEKHKLEADYYRHRLNQLCEEISKDPGSTITGVKTKCRNLEVTVDLLERATWLEEIYRLPPDATSDGESQGEPSVLNNKAQSPTARPTPPSQIIDLGSPSDTSEPEDDEVPLTGVSATPVQYIDGNDPDQKVQIGASTSDSIIIDTIESPLRGSVATSTPTVHSRALLDEAPEHASVSTVNRWSWDQLEETQDRKRAVSKAINELSSTERRTIKQRLQSVGRANMVREILTCIDMFLRGDNKIPGVLPQDLSKIVTFTKLFLCWWSCSNCFKRDLSKLELAELAECLRQHAPDPATFHDYVSTVLSTTFSHAALSRSTQPSQAEIIEISDDDEPPSQLPVRRKSNNDKGGLGENPAIVID